MTHRWINPDNQRYYTAQLVQDIFGDWTLVACWGGLHSKRGGMRITQVASHDQGQQEIKKIAKRRRQRGYEVLVESKRSRESLPESG